MSEDLHDIDNLFKSAIDAHEEVPSEKVWEAIDAGLDKQNAASVKQKYSSIKKIAAVLLLLLLSSVIYILTNNNHLTDQKNISSKENVTNNNASEISSDKQINNNAFKENPAKQQNQTEKIIITLPEKTITEKTNKNISSVESNNPDSQTYTDNNIIVKKATGRQLKNKKSTRAKTSVSITQSEIEEVTDYETNDIIPLDKTMAEKIIIEKPTLQIHPLSNKISITDQQNPAVVSSKKSPGKPSFNATVFFSPAILSMRLKDDAFGSPGTREEIKEGEIEHVSFETGVLIDYALNKKWAIGSGLYYSSKNYGINPRKIYADLDNTGSVKYKFVCSSGYWYVNPKTGTSPAVGDSLNTLESTAFLNFISIPLSVKYTLPYKRFSFFATLGTSLNFLTMGKIKTEIESGSNETEAETSQKIYGLKSSYFSGITSIGSTYKLTNKFSLSFAPTFNFAITPVTKNAPVKSYPNTLGFAAGLKYNF